MDVNCMLTDVNCLGAYPLQFSVPNKRKHDPCTNSPTLTTHFQPPAPQNDPLVLIAGSETHRNIGNNACVCANSPTQAARSSLLRRSTPPPFLPAGSETNGNGSKTTGPFKFHARWAQIPPPVPQHAFSFSPSRVGKMILQLPVLAT